MSYIFEKLCHLAIIWPIRKSFSCILKGVRFLQANHTQLSGTSETFSYQSSQPYWYNMDWHHIAGICRRKGCFGRGKSIYSCLANFIKSSSIWFFSSSENLFHAISLYSTKIKKTAVLLLFCKKYHPSIVCVSFQMTRKKVNFGNLFVR